MCWSSDLPPYCLLWLSGEAHSRTVYHQIRHHKGIFLLNVDCALSFNSTSKSCSLFLIDGKVAGGFQSRIQVRYISRVVIFYL